jgi:hypothetical protein
MTCYLLVASRAHLINDAKAKESAEYHERRLQQLLTSEVAVVGAIAASGAIEPSGLQRELELAIVW